MEVYIGTIMPAAFNFAPQGWLPCDGRLLPIANYTALFGTIGFSYGGDGKDNFALPDLRGRVQIGSSLSPPPSDQLALTTAQLVGKPTVDANANGTIGFALNASNLPGHTHQVDIAAKDLVATSTMHVSKTNGQAVPVTSAALSAGAANAGGQATIYAPATTPDIPLQADTVQTTLEPVSVTSDSTGGNAIAPVVAAVGASATFSTLQPSVGLNFIICYDGIFPVRS